MDDPKQRALRYLGSERVRFSRHFNERSRERRVARVDVQRVLCSGAWDPRRSEGDNLAFVGTDHGGRRLCVIVRIDERADRLVFLSVFPLAKGTS